ncbi:MAG: hypothetical protein AVDCRST_MAG74-3351, partial [uncultured Pyrinomonadaceae bacterium]
WGLNFPQLFSFRRRIFFFINSPFHFFAFCLLSVYFLLY